MALFYFTPQSDAWFQARNKYITGTQISSIFGLNPAQSWKKVMRDKIIPPVKIDNKYMRAGRLLEPSVILALNELGIAAKAAHTSKVVFMTDEEARISATMDAKLKTKQGFYIVECKTTKIEKFEEWKTQVPIYYSLQVQAQLLVANVDKALIACLGGLHPDYPIIVYEIRADKIIQNMMKEECQRLWKAFEEDMENPKFEINKDYKDYIKYNINKSNKIIVD